MTTLGIVSMIFFLSVAWGGIPARCSAYAVKQRGKENPRTTLGRISLESR